MKTLVLTPQKGFFTLNGELWSGIKLHFRKYIHYKDKKPKTYKEVGGFICNERGKYESGCVTIYKTRRGYAASLYKDGCFKPYYATCTLIEYNKPY